MVTTIAAPMYLRFLLNGENKKNLSPIKNGIIIKITATLTKYLFIPVRLETEST